MPIHLRPPFRSELSHGPNDRAARHRNHAPPREQPTIPDSRDDGFGRNGTDAGEDIADEIVGRDAGGGLAGHEFCEHGGGHAEDDHATDAEEEIRDELEKGEAEPYQRCKVLVSMYERKKRKEKNHTGIAQKRCFSDVHPYQIKAPGYTKAAIHAFSRMRSSGLYTKFPCSSFRSAFLASRAMMWSVHFPPIKLARM